MKKHLLLFLLALFTAALPGLAEDVLVQDCTFNTSGWSTGTSSYTTGTCKFTNDAGFILDLSNCNNNGKGWNYVKVGQKSNTNNTATISTNTPIAEPITKVVVNVQKNVASATVKLTLNTSSNSSFTNNGETKEVTGTSVQDITFELNPANSDLYYQLSINSNNNTSTNGAISINGIKFYTTSGGGEEVTIAAPTFDPVSGSTVTVGDKLIISCATTGATLSGMIGDDFDFEVETSSYTYTFTEADAQAGEVLVMAQASKDGLTSEDAEATYTVKAKSTDPDPIEPENPTAGEYVLINNTNDLEAGAKYIIAHLNGNKYYAMNTTVTSNKIETNEVTVSNNKLIPVDATAIFVLEADGTKWKLKCENNGQYINVATSGTNLNFNNTGTANTIEFEDDYVQIDNSRRVFPNTDNKYGSYATSNWGKDGYVKPSLYKFVKSSGGEEPPVTGPVELIKFEYSAATASWDLSASDNAALPTLEIQPADANLTITYKSSNTDVATVATDGTVTPVGEGTTTITATFTGNDKYNKAEASYTLTVTKSNTGGETPEPGTSITDVIDNAFTGVGTASSYSNWTKSSTTSGATYVGNSAGSYSSVQLRSTNDAGIVTTVSGGTAAKIKLTWNNNTSANRTVDIYGSNTPYTATSDLYNNAAKKIQSISVGDEKEYTLSGNYKYIGIRSASSALYLDKIEITWEQGGEDAIATPEFSCVDNKVSISCATEGAEIYYTMDGQTPDKSATKYDGKAIEITATTTFKAIACLNDKESQVAEYKAYYIPAQPMKVVEAIALINDGFEGELTAKGIVNRTTNFNTSFGSITYYISDDGTTTNELQVYGGLNIGGAKFNAQSDIEAGATVTVKGNVKLYNGNPEFDTNNVLIEYIPPKHEVIPQGPSFMITFGNVEGSQDGSNSVSSESLLKSLVSGKEYVESATEITNAYQGLKGLKIGKDKEAGSITLNLSHLGQRKVTYIVANASTWKDSNAKLVINGQEIALESAELADYAIELNGDRLESITLASTNASDYRLYVQGLTIYYEEEPAASNLTLTHSGGDELVLNETEVTAKADNATYYIVRKYNLDGTYTEEPVEDVEATFTVDKMHRRFEVVAGNAMGETEPVPAFYNIGKEETTTTEGGAKHYELVTDPTAIQAGDKLAIAVKGSTNMLFMSTEHETNASKGFVPVESNVSSKNESDHTAIEELPATAMILEVEYDTYNGMKLKNDNGYLYVGDGEISYKQTIQTGTTFTASKLDNQTENYILLASSTYIIKCNNGYGYFRGYKSTSGSVLDTKIYKEVGGSTTTTTLVADNPVYTVTLNFLEEATARGEMRTLAVPTDHEITIKGGTDGVTTYETQLPEDKVLAGTFNITVGVDGETLTLGGHRDYATTEFHNYKLAEGDEGCSEEHAPYVYVGQDASNSAQVVSGLKLVNVDDKDAVDLSTHPNVYHGFVREYTEPTISLSLDPFKEITLGLDSTSGTTTSVNNIAVDSQNGEDVYYNLQGVRVDARNMVPGVYIRVNGKTSTKVLVK